MAEIIGIASAKGGVGKTTVALNLSLALSRYFKKRVLLIDLNLTAPHISTYVGIFSSKNINCVMRNDCKIEDVIQLYFYDLNLIVCSEKIEDLIGVDFSILRNEIEKIKEKYDYVILDLAPGIGREASNGILISQKILIVTNPDIASVTDSLRIKKISNFFSKEIIGIVLNKVKGKNYELREKDIESFTNLKVLVKIPYDDEFLKGLAIKLPPLAKPKPNQEIKQAFINLASLITKEKIERKKSFWEKLKEFFNF